MSLKMDMEHGLGSGSHNFHTEVIRLMQKADLGNYARLKGAFPNTAAVYEAWCAGEEVPDLPYEGQG